MLIKSLEIHNILSIEDISISFGERGLILVDGWNHDDDTANGAGKTSIWNALSFGLYGKLPRKVTASEIVRRGAKEGYVKINVETPHGLVYIERARPKRDVITLDGKEIPSQEELEKILKMSYKQFLICMYSSQSGSMKFIDMNDSEKKDFFLDLLGLERFDIVKHEIDDELKVLLESVGESNAAVERFSIKIETSKAHIEDETELKKQISDLNPAKLEAQLAAIDLTKPDTSVLEDLKSTVSDNIVNIKRDLSQKSFFEDQIESLDQEISELEDEINNHSNCVTCPHCEGKFILTNGSISTGDVRDRYREKIQNRKAKRAELVSKINDMGGLRAKLEKWQEKAIQVENKKKKMLSDYNDRREAVSDIKGKIQLRKAKIASLSERLTNSQKITSTIKTFKAQIATLQAQIELLQQEVEVNKTLSSVFAPTGAPAYVLDSAIDIFNQRVSDYVSMIWPNASYSLLSYKENKAGIIKAKLSDKLIIAGREVSLGSLSGGELRCLCLSIDFAIVELMETLGGYTINPYILDEPFEGLDASNRERAVSMLEKLAQNRQIWTIDHASEAKAMFSDIVRIEKKNGISRIVE